MCYAVGTWSTLLGADVCLCVTSGTMAFRGDLASWSMLLHGAAPVYQYAPQQMRKLLDTAMQWIKRHKAEVRAN